MEGPSTRRALLRQVADRLIGEYAGILPPGQVLAVVFKANHSVGLQRSIARESRLALCEQFARELLSQRVAAHARVPVSLAS